MEGLFVRRGPTRFPSRLQLPGVRSRICGSPSPKTREARKRAAHGSLLRRVCVSMVRDASLNKESHNPDAGVEGAYDVDWTSGTVWLNQHKIGSCSHRAPRGDSVKLLSSGWVDVVAARPLG